MTKDLHSTTAIVLFILFGGVIFFHGTDGFQAYTSESARTYQLMKSQPALPAITLEDSRGKTYTFDKLTNDKFVFITFMYTSCGSVCPKLEMNMAKVYEAIPKQYLGKEIVFLSLSFDPENDDPDTLRKYGKLFGSDEETWRMARINDKTELDALLDRLGIVVIPDGYGNFQHNSAFYLIDKDGDLAEVMDFMKTTEAAERVNTLLAEGGI